MSYDSKTLILVNEKDEPIGYGEKMEVHRQGLLHRAFSIFVLNEKNEVLLQQRAKQKYHSGGLWANTCCSHPIKGEGQQETVKRRLMEEMGFETELHWIFSFIYQVRLDNSLTEYEYDHVYYGMFDGEPKPNPDEVSDWRWMQLDALKDDLCAHPERYVYWLKPAFEQFNSHHKTLLDALNP